MVVFHWNLNGNKSHHFSRTLLFSEFKPIVTMLWSKWTQFFLFPILSHNFFCFKHTNYNWYHFHPHILAFSSLAVLSFRFLLVSLHRDGKVIFLAKTKSGLLAGIECSICIFICLILVDRLLIVRISFGQISISCGSSFLPSYVKFFFLFILVCCICLLCDWPIHFLSTKRTLIILLNIMDFHFNIIGPFCIVLYCYLKFFSWGSFLSHVQIFSCAILPVFLLKYPSLFSFPLVSQEVPVV